MRMLHLLALILLISGFSAYAESPSTEKAEGSPVPESAAKDSKKSGSAAHPHVFRGYGRYHDLCKSSCRLLAQDGRIDAFLTLLKEHVTRDPLCIACVPLVEAFVGPCTSERERAKKKVAAALKTTETPSPEGAPIVKPTPTAKREPHPALIDALSQLFIQLASDKEFLVDNLRAVSTFVYFLRNPGRATPAEKEYFGILAEYIDAPFVGARQELEREKKTEGGSQVESRPTVSADALFEE